MTGGNGGIEAAKKRRLKIHETTLENDIRYRGPLSPTHFKILGWLCIVIAQVAALIRLAGRIDAGIAASSASWLNALDNIAALSLPFLLIVNFAQLLNAHDGYRTARPWRAYARCSIWCFTAISWVAWRRF